MGFRSCLAEHSDFDEADGQAHAMLALSVMKLGRCTSYSSGCIGMPRGPLL